MTRRGERVCKKGELTGEIRVFIGGFLVNTKGEGAIVTLEVSSKGGGERHFQDKQARGRLPRKESASDGVHSPVWRKGSYELRKSKTCSSEHEL